MGGILLLGLNVCLTSNEIVILFDKGFVILLFFMLFLHNLYDDSYILRLSFDAVPAIEKYDKSGELLADYFNYGDYPYYESNQTGGALQGKKNSLRTWYYSLQKTYRIYDEYRAKQKSGL